MKKEMDILFIVMAIFYCLTMIVSIKLDNEQHKLLQKVLKNNLELIIENNELKNKKEYSEHELNKSNYKLKTIHKLITGNKYNNEDVIKNKIKELSDTSQVNR